MNIVAFLQNPGFKPGTPMTIVDKYKSQQQFHRELLETTMSGARLKVAFGEYWFNRIWWDNANPNIPTYGMERLDPDILHIEKVIADQKPKLVLTFGKQAERGVSSSIAAIALKVMSCHHPNARFRTQSDLDQFAQDVIQYVIVKEQQEVRDES